MVQLFEGETAGTVAKPILLRGAAGSIIVHSLFALVLLSTIYWPVEMATDRVMRVTLVAPLPPAPPPPPAPVIKAARVAAVHTARVFSPVLTAPTAIPQHAAVVIDAIEAPPELIAGVPGEVPGGVPGGILGGVLGGAVADLAPPPPPPAAAPKPTKAPEPQAPPRISVDSEIQAAKLLVAIQPDYPLMAKQARIQGAVHLSAVIDRDGRITDLKVLDGNPLLVGAACNAVSKWRYQPTFLHGEAVEVVTSITVKFRLTT